jgi:hypothetical protein
MFLTLVFTLYAYMVIIRVCLCYRQKLTWSIWAKKRAAIKMSFEDNHD